VLVGTSGAGKSTTGERIARKLGQPFVELDELFWSADWQPKPAHEFRALVRAAAAGERWVVAGNYGSARAELWPRASAVVWLNFGIVVVLKRVVARTIRRLVRREALWHGNRESWWRTLFTRDSIVWWTLTTHNRRKREFADLRSSSAYPHLHWYEFTRPADVEHFLAAER
jgi:adenylate kinase family enzyme